LGAPRKNRRKYEKPKDIWNLQRIHADNELITEYGLKNMKELWKVQSNISRIRGNVRELLSGGSQNRLVERDIIASIAKLGIVQETATLDGLLEIKENAFLERRLESMVFRRGMARSMKQARQLITHGFIAVNGRRTSKPGYLVTAGEEQHISYYKPIDVNVNVQVKEVKKAESSEGSAAVEAPAAAPEETPAISEGIQAEVKDEVKGE
jgi:small subunit ribosomal protein S4